MVSSGMLRRVALVRTDASEELSASFIRVARIGELGTSLQYKFLSMEKFYFLYIFKYYIYETFRSKQCYYVRFEVFHGGGYQEWRLVGRYKSHTA
jgi:hypothetical protein